MWATLTLAGLLTVAPAQTGDLKLTNDRVTYGPSGPVRKDKKFLPGDVYFLTFDVDGLKFDGPKASYTLNVDLLDSKGKPMFKTITGQREVFAVQGSGPIPGWAPITIEKDTMPGEYTLKISATDNATKKSATLSRTFEVGEKAFAIVQVFTAYGQDGQIPTSCGAVGQLVFFHFRVIGFDRDPKTKQPKVQLEMRLLDEAGKPTLDKPISQDLKDQTVPESFSHIPLWMDLALTRPGKFTIELKVTDQLTNKTATISYPFQVIDAPK
jgi:hypothetical protein